MSKTTKTIMLTLTAIIMASQWSDVGANNRCYGQPMGNQGEFPCNQYFHVCRRHIEGYEGYLRLPVLQEMSPWRQSKADRKLFENGDVNITFNTELSVLHAWEEDAGLRSALGKGNKQNFTIFIKDVYRDRMESLSNGQKYRMDLTFRSPLLHPNNPGNKGGDKTIGITSIRFGNFICPEPVAPTVNSLPACRIFMLDGSITDGYRAVAVFKAPSTKNHWVSTIQFPVSIRNFDTPNGDKERVSDKELKIKSLRHNGRQHEGSEFHLEFTVHVYGDNDAERRLNKRAAKKIVRMTFNEFVCEGASFVRKWS